MNSGPEISFRPHSYPDFIFGARGQKEFSARGPIAATKTIYIKGENGLPLAGHLMDYFSSIFRHITEMMGIGRRPNGPVENPQDSAKADRTRNLGNLLLEIQKKQGHLHGRREKVFGPAATQAYSKAAGHRARQGKKSGHEKVAQAERKVASLMEKHGVSAKAIDGKIGLVHTRHALAAAHALPDAQELEKKAGAKLLEMSLKEPQGIGKGLQGIGKGLQAKGGA
ncbi:MAG: hypothetical protein AAB316_14030, partial [Bacteroidota bacterium]